MERGEQQPRRQELYSSVVTLVGCKSYLAKSASGLSLLFILLYREGESVLAIDDAVEAVVS